jgi:hypothetical protein
MEANCSWSSIWNCTPWVLGAGQPQTSNQVLSFVAPEQFRLLDRRGFEVGKREKTGAKRTPQLSGLVATRAEVEASFREMVKSLRCPSCDLEFTDFALIWGDAWLEGRHDLMVEDGGQERDGPYKLKCELCGHRSWLNYFARSVSSAERPDTSLE